MPEENKYYQYKITWLDDNGTELVMKYASDTKIKGVAEEFLKTMKLADTTKVKRVEDITKETTVTDES